jgi:hypothetical protein
VEINVDFFSESGGNITFSPLAKACAVLVQRTTPYLSISN